MLKGGDPEGETQRSETTLQGNVISKGVSKSLKPQSDSPMASKEGLKMLMVIAMTFKFKLASIDIRAATSK